jgi:hypothetical protein
MLNLYGKIIYPVNSLFRLQKYIEAYAENPLKKTIVNIWIEYLEASFEFIDIFLMLENIKKNGFEVEVK